MNIEKLGPTHRRHPTVLGQKNTKTRDSAFCTPTTHMLRFFLDV